jgi:ABC-type xylose transport system substrate-binding protein
MQTEEALRITKDVMERMEQAQQDLTEEVVKLAKANEQGIKQLERMENAISSIGKLLVLLDFDPTRDLDLLKKFRSQGFKS